MGHGNALISFHGTKVDDATGRLLEDPRVAGVVLYRPHNIGTAAQTRELCQQLVTTAGRPLLIAIDQEGGQLLGAGPDFTPFAGNMALGAVDDAGLAMRVAAAIGQELRAVGINVDLAPVVDVATRPYNPSMGIRSFGEDPALVSRMTTAFVSGLQGAGVAATLKHFPGKGEAAVDPHDELPVLDLDLDRLNRVEFAPFRSGIEAGALLLMVGHYGLPAITGDQTTPTSVSSEVMVGLLRETLGFEGIVVTDALDMGGFGGRETEAPLAAGADLLLYGPAQFGLLPQTSSDGSPRIGSVVGWLASHEDPDLAVVGSPRHLELAEELARRSITLVRGDPGVLPLRPDAGDRILAVMPEPRDLTPADTSSYEQPGLARSLRRRHEATTELVVSFEPDPEDVSRVVKAASTHSVVVVGTIDANLEQAELVKAVLSTGVPTVVAALRTPYDLVRFPEAPTYVCTYGILPPSLDALADALFGTETEGCLPVAIPGLYPVGHGLAKGSTITRGVPS